MELLIRDDAAEVSRSGGVAARSWWTTPVI